MLGLAANIDDHQVGWRANPSDTAGFIQAIRDAYESLQSRDEANAMSERARALAVNELSKKVILDRYVASILDVGSAGLASPRK